jgi:hypothetical protein
LISGVLSFAGESGSLSVMLGVPGGVDCSTYANESEQVDSFPAASIVRALRFVVASL